MDDEVNEEFHPLVLPDAPIVMPTGALLPVVREGTVGGIPAYEADQGRPCGCPGNEVCLHGTPALLMDLEPTTRDVYLGIPRG